MIDRLEARLGGKGATVAETERTTNDGDEAPPADSEGGDPETPWPEEPAGAVTQVETEEPAKTRDAAPGGATEEAEPALPSLDELVQQIPPGARVLLDELFRAKFTTVRRVPPAALKEKATTARG